MGIDGFDACEDLSGDFSFDDEMMIMVGLTSFEIDQVIKGFHKKRIAGIPLKAVLTAMKRKGRMTAGG